MATPKLYPLTFDPVFKDYVWGGRNLADKLGRQLPAGIVAESWDVAAHPNGSSVVNQGPLQGKTLAEVMALWGADLVGSNSEQALELGKFPLLIKLLDANRWLSVQVHPNDTYGLAHEGEFGKTEMWVVLDAEPGADIVYGFKPGVTREQYAQEIKEDRAADSLHRLPVKKGDVIFVPAGAVHALGPGIMVAEIQQNSDTTYRVFDWNRLGLDGKPRPLHISESLQCIDFTDAAPAFGIPRGEMLVECPFFRVVSLSISPAGTRTIGKPGEFAMVVVINGSGHLASVPLRPGDHVVLPAMAEDRTLTTTSGIRVLQVNFGAA